MKNKAIILDGLSALRFKYNEEFDRVYPHDNPLKKLINKEITRDEYLKQAEALGQQRYRYVCQQVFENEGYETLTRIADPEICSSYTPCLSADRQCHFDCYIKGCKYANQ